MNLEHVVWAAALGGISAASLPLGSIVGLAWPPRPRVTGGATAFGAGALIAALAVELVAPTAAHVHEGGDGAFRLVSLLVGAVAGGLLFVALDQLVNRSGGFLRKTATTITFLGKARSRRHALLLEQLSRVPALRNVPPEHVDALVNVVRPESFTPGEVLFREGDPGESLVFVVSGTLQVLRRGERVATLGPGEVVGEIALVTGAPRTATVQAEGTVEALVLRKDDFERLREMSPTLDAAAAALASERLDALRTHDEKHVVEATRWAAAAAEALRQRTVLPTPQELRDAREEHGGAPLAIWLGILLDGIPESFVIGSSLIAILAAKAAAGAEGVAFLDVMPWTLVAGLFLSNFPEAMSSSVGMRSHGWSRSRVFVMWFALMAMTAAGAAIGFAVGEGTSEAVLVLVEGVAAGAMLTMIASTMVPEAVHIGGATITGLGTLAGFLAAVAFKLLE